MGRITLSPSGLRIRSVGDGGSEVQSDMNFNWSRLNSTLLKFAGLLNVSVTGLNDSQIVQYDANAGEFKPKEPSIQPIPIGASTSTTVTTTSTTTTTTVSTTTTYPPESYSTGMTEYYDSVPGSGEMDYRNNATDGDLSTKIFSKAPQPPPYPYYQDFDSWNAGYSVGINLESSQLCYGLKIAFRMFDNGVGYLNANWGHANYMAPLQLYQSSDGINWTLVRDFEYDDVREYGVEVREGELGLNERTEVINGITYPFYGDSISWCYYWSTTPVTNQYFKLRCYDDPDHRVVHTKVWKPVEVVALLTAAEQQPTVGWQTWTPAFVAGAPVDFYGNENHQGWGGWTPEYGNKNYSLGAGSDPFGYRDAILGSMNNQLRHLVVEETKTSGKWYIEFTHFNLRLAEGSAEFAGDVWFGFAQEQWWRVGYDPIAGINTKYDTFTNSSDPADSYLTWGYRSDGKLISAGVNSAFGAGTFLRGDVIGCAIDIDNERIWFSKNGVWQGAPASGTGAAFTSFIFSGTYSYDSGTYNYFEGIKPMVSVDGRGITYQPWELVKCLTHSFNQNYSAPSGFTPWGD